MSKKSSVPEYMREMLAAFEMLRRLGYSADDLFCVRYRNMVALELHTQGMRFTIECGGPVSMSDEKFDKLWKRAARMWNGEQSGMSMAERQRLFHKSRMVTEGGFAVLIDRLIMRGFVVPFMEKAKGADPSVLLNAQMCVNSAGGKA